jgi:hypothetical protein
MDLEPRNTGRILEARKGKERFSSRAFRRNSALLTP